MEDYIIKILTNFSYIGICFLIFLENVFPPIPSELILVFGGFISKKLELNFFLMVILSTVGSVLGALMLYYIGKKISIEKLESFLEKKWIKRLGFKSGDINKTLKYFEKYNTLSVFIGRCIPVVRSLISIPAGMQKMEIKKFIFYTGVGSLIWNIILIYIGRVMEDKWEEGLVLLEKYSSIIISIVIVVVLVKVLYKKYGKKKVIKDER